MSMEKIKNVYDLVEEGQKDYENQTGIKLEEGWSWSMKGHLSRSYLYLNSQFEDNNENRDLRPNKNIVLPIMNVQYRTEGFDVKDINLYVNNPDEYFKSLLVNKYHNKWALENGMDTFIDDMVVSYCNYGGVLVKKTDDARPEVIDLRTLAFCNQTDILVYPFAIEYEYSPAELRKANKKWGQDSYGATVDIEELIVLAKKEDDKTIKVYEVHGLLPKNWLIESDTDEYDEEEEDVHQIQVISFYKKEDESKQGVTLFKHKEPELPFKFLARDKVEGRALGRGGIEELFESQIWTNWDEIKVTEMLEAASKTLFWSNDPTFKSKNNLSNVDNNEVLGVMGEGKIGQLDTYPRNLAVFNDSVERWFKQAQLLGGGPDPLMGETPTAGTPFKLYEAQQIEGKGMHKYRQGQLAVFMDEIYRDWVLPHLAREIVKEQEFMQELSADEMQMVMDKVMTKKTNDFKKRMILSLQEIDEDLVADYQEQVKTDVIKQGNKRFFKILKDEMKDTKLSVLTNIAGKQKNLALLTDKLVNVLRQYIATPQIRQDPEMTKLLNTILESSGLSPIMFGPAPAQQQQTQPSNSTQPLQALGEGGVNQQQAQQV